MKTKIAAGLLFIIVLMVIIFWNTKKDDEEQQRKGDIIRDIIENDAGAENDIQQEIEYIDGFEKADYEKYNSYASENGLGDTLIYIEGTVQSKKTNDNVLSFILRQDDGNEWLVSILQSVSIEKYEGIVDELIGKRVRAFGIYNGYSDKYNMPFVALLDENSRIDVENNPNEFETVYTFIDYYEQWMNKKPWEDFASNKEELIQWYTENPCEILYEEYRNEENAGTFKESSGIVKEIESWYSSDNLWLELYQKTENGYVGQTVAIMSDFFYDEMTFFEEFSEGEGIKLYYYIDDENKIIFLAVEKVEPEFTLNEVVDDYKNRCSEYTYEDMARNPERVKGEQAKVTGEVIQVLEDGDHVVMRVNITEGKYSYSDTIYVDYYRHSATEDRILEGDIITIYGTLRGLETYTSVLGASVSIPRIDAEYIDLIE